MTLRVRTLNLAIKWGCEISPGIASAKAHDQSRDSFPERSALLPPHKCGGSTELGMERSAASFRVLPQGLRAILLSGASDSPQLSTQWVANELRWAHTMAV
jgi:hypothetical protein